MRNEIINLTLRKLITTIVTTIITSIMMAFGIVKGTNLEIGYYQGNEFIGWFFIYFVYIGVIILIYGNLVSVGIEYVQRKWFKQHVWLYILLHTIFGLVNGVFFQERSLAFYGMLAALLYACIDRWLFKRELNSKIVKMVFVIPIISLFLCWGFLQLFSPSLPPFTKEDAVEFATDGEGTIEDSFPKKIGKWQGTIDGFQVERETDVIELEDEISHYHGDHVFGNQVFEDVTIISTSLTKKWFEDQNSIIDVAKEIEEMNRYLDNLKNQLESTIDPILKCSLSNQYLEMSKVLEELPHLKMVFPSVIFEKHLAIQGSNRNVELHCLGGGHSPSDAFLYLPIEKIAFMGDIVTEDLHLPIYDPDVFLRILNEVNKIEIKTLIPGHGDIGTLELCDTLADYLSFLIDKIKEALENKVSLHAFISEFITPSEYANWKGVNGITRNLTTLYHFYAKKEE